MKEETKQKIGFWIIMILNYIWWGAGLIAFIYYFKKDKQKSNIFLVNTIIACLIYSFFGMFVNVYSLILSMLPIVIIIAFIIGIIIYIYKLGEKINQPKGLLYISLFIPLAGLILYCVYIKKEEQLGKSCGKLALIGLCFPIICALIVFGFGALRVAF